MKVVYRLIGNNIQSELVDDGYELKDNETFEKPVDGIYQPFSFSNGLIIGVTQTEWENSIQTNQLSLTEDDDQLAALSQTVLEQSALLAQQSEQIKQLQGDKESENNNVQSN